MQHNYSKQIAFALLVAGAAVLVSGWAATLYVTNYDTSLINIVVPGSTTGGTIFASTGVNAPEGLALDSGGNLYVANSGSGNIRQYTSSGTVINPQFASIGAAGSSAPGTYAYGLALDSSGNLYVADGNNDTISKVSSGGSVSIFVPGTAGLNDPAGLALDSGGNLYVANYGSDTDPGSPSAR